MQYFEHTSVYLYRDLDKKQWVSPGMVGGPGEITGMQRVLDSYSEQGWELVSVATEYRPSYLEVNRGQMFVAGYRMFFKRPR